MALVRSAWNRIRTVDPRVVDAVVAVALMVAAVAQLVARDGAGALLHLPGAVEATLLLWWRRRYPLACFPLQFGGALLILEPPPLAVLIALFVGLYSAGAYGRRRLVALALPVGSAAVVAVLFPGANPPVPAWGLQLLGGVGAWLAGDAVRLRQARAAELEERARRLERERELTARVAVADERARIARELHDVIAHGVSVMVVQAGAARRLLAGPETAAGSAAVVRAGEAVREVEAGGREALTELRRLLGVLAERPEEAVLAPQPGMLHLEALVERLAAAGVAVSLRVDGDRRRLAPGVDLAAYRVVQEALTNVVKHAAGARAEVVVEYGERDLRLAVVDDGGGGGSAVPAEGAGRGLLGMRERVAACGGELDVGRRPEGGFSVRARLPLEPA